jgi:tetratricopeptide (TPR) repeat protein
MNKRFWAVVLAAVLAAAGAAADQRDELALAKKYKMAEPFVQKAQKYADQDKFDKCDRELDRCFEAVPDHHSANYVKAQELYKQGDFAAALDRIGRAKAGFIRLAAAMRALQAKMLQGEIDKAQELSDYGEALSDWRAASNATCAVGRIAVNSTKINENEREIQGQMTQKEADVPAEYEYVAGNCLFKMKRLDEAAAAYEAALAIDPAHANAFNNIINVFYVQKRMDDARAWLDRAEKAKVKIHPGLKKAVLEN